jgi:hypothetical protein
MITKKLIIVSVVCFAAAAGIGLVVFQKKSSPFSVTTRSEEVPTTPKEEPLTEACPLNGKLYGASAKALWQKRRPLGIAIENHIHARPQSGISSADVVYEAVTEGGVSRTLSIFYCQDAPYVGPVRSARVHFINLLRQWGDHPLFAHVGGANCHLETGSGCANGARAAAIDNPYNKGKAPGLVSKLGWTLYNDMDESSIGTEVFRRDPERLPQNAPLERTEHTMYSSTKRIWDFAAKKRNLTEVNEDGERWDANWKPWKFVDEAVTSARGDQAYIAYDFYDSNAHQYGVVWKYDAKTNEYLRENGGEPHLDLNTKKQLSAKNIIIMEAKERPANDDYPGGHVIYDLVGSGVIHIFQNGTYTKGKWIREALESNTRYIGADKEELPLVRGAIWIALVPEGNIITVDTKPPVKVEKTVQKPKTVKSIDE